MNDAEPSLDLCVAMFNVSDDEVVFSMFPPEPRQTICPQSGYSLVKILAYLEMERWTN